jgi:hypothetical protein
MEFACSSSLKLHQRRNMSCMVQNVQQFLEKHNDNNPQYEEAVAPVLRKLSQWVSERSTKKKKSEISDPREHA